MIGIIVVAIVLLRLVLAVGAVGGYFGKKLAIQAMSSLLELSSAGTLLFPPILITRLANRRGRNRRLILRPLPWPLPRPFDPLPLLVFLNMRLRR